MKIDYNSQPSLLDLFPFFLLPLCLTRLHSIPLLPRSSSFFVCFSFLLLWMRQLCSPIRFLLVRFFFFFFVGAKGRGGGGRGGRMGCLKNFFPLFRCKYASGCHSKTRDCVEGKLCMSASPPSSLIFFFVDG